MALGKQSEGTNFLLIYISLGLNCSLRQIFPLEKFIRSLFGTLVFSGINKTLFIPPNSLWELLRHSSEVLPL